MRDEKGRFIKGNKDAEKWTEETALDFIERVQEYNENNPNNYHLGLPTIECGGYPDVWVYLAKKFSKVDSVFSAIKKAEAFLEARIINSTISGEAKSAAMAIFYLKNKHGYVDKRENEDSVSIAFKVPKTKTAESDDLE